MCALCTVGHLSYLLGAGSYIKCSGQVGDNSSIWLAAGDLGGSTQDVDFTVIAY